MTDQNRKEITHKIAEAQTEIFDMLRRIENSLIDCRDTHNNWSDVAEANRLRDDLRAILEYRK